MDFKKKMTSVLMASTLVAGMLAGCGSKEAGTGGAGDSGGDTIKIGANLELSGAVASYGSSIAAGIALAVDEINKDGGVDGKKLKIIKVDNKSDAAEATNAAIKLTSKDKVTAIIGAATSGNTVAQAQIANNSKTLLISPSGTSPTVTVQENGKVNEFVFRTSFIDPFQGTVAANFATNNLKVKKAAIFADNASDYAKGLAASFKETFEASGGKVVSGSYVAKDTDFHSQLTRIKGEKPEFIFIPGYYEEVGLIIKQAREMGITVPFMGADGWDSPKLVDLAGADALNNTYITNHYSSGDPDKKIQKFVTSFNKKYDGKSPDAFNALGYDTVYLLVDAMKRAGSTSDTTKIQKALAATKDLSLVTGTITIDENHHLIKSATVLEYKDGKQEFNSKVNP